jgi:hypothetical protein
LYKGTLWNKDICIHENDVLIQWISEKILSYFSDMYFVFFEFPKIENAQVQIRNGSWSLLHWSWPNAVVLSQRRAARWLRGKGGGITGPGRTL